ncbi:Polymerase/histidinol phosphatase-like protein [Pilobolus umbonatus]|nr:Polymerase/histidinol phosphatase-like protein [Pilobolus umbonatus]
MPYSFHSHSGQFCKHGYGLLEDVVKEAIRKGFYTYGLSEHMPRYVDTELYPEEIEACCTPHSLGITYNEFITEARRLQPIYKDKIQLVIGAEIEFINQDYIEHVNQLKNKADYIVGSLHHVSGIPIDFSPELYQQALKHHNNSLKQLFIQYFNEQYMMLQSVQPQVIGHFDLIRIFADQSLAEETLLDKDVWACIVRNIDMVISYGGLFEINSRAWKKGLRDAYPQRNIIKVIQEKKGRFTLSDDCHGPQDVGLFYNKLPVYLRDNDIHTIYYLGYDKDKKVIVHEHMNILNDAFWNRIREW